MKKLMRYTILLNNILFFSFFLKAQDCAIILPPKQLLNTYNFHVMAPFIYGSHLKAGVNSNWGKEVYLSCAKALEAHRTTPPHEYINRIDESFHTMKEQHKQLDAVVINKQNAILEGAHQVAINLLFDQPVYCQQQDMPTQYKSIYPTLKNSTIDEDILDAMAYKYCLTHPQTHCVILFPKGVPFLNIARKTLQEYGEIIYEKQFVLKDKGPRILLQHIPDKKPHIDFQYPYYFNGVKQFTFHLFLFQNPHGQKHMTECKKLIRKKIGLGNWVIHADDSNDDSKHTAPMVLLNSSIHFMNHAHIAHYPNFQKLFQKYTRWIKNHKLSPDHFCIDHGSVLAAYGIRECGDLDFIHDGYENLLPQKPCLPLFGNGQRYQ